MALTERAFQLATTPLRLVQQAAGGDGQETQQLLDQSLRPVRQDLDALQSEVAALRSDLEGVGELKSELEALRKQIRNLRSKVNDIHEDTQHIRTEQAAEVANAPG